MSSQTVAEKMSSMDSIKKALLLNVFVDEVGVHSGLWLTGSTKEIGELIEEVRTEWEKWRKTDSEASRIVLLEVDVDVKEENTTMEDWCWGVWKRVMKQIDLSAMDLGGAGQFMAEQEMAKINSHNSGWKESVRSVLEYLKAAEYQLILIMNNLQNAIMEKGEDKAGFFMYLFSLSPKKKEYYMTTLFVSEEDMNTVAEPHMELGSRFSAAYGEGVL